MIRPVAPAGRSRGKIENENNNALKNQGYHLEYNYSHSQQYLVAVVVMSIESWGVTPQGQRVHFAGRVPSGMSKTVTIPRSVCA
jgi:hypothetical protein